jgi:hypothetical protein
MNKQSGIFDQPEYQKLFKALDEFYGHGNYYVRDDDEMGGIRIDVKTDANRVMQTFERMTEFRTKIWPKVGKGIFDRVYFDIDEGDADGG